MFVMRLPLLALAGMVLVFGTASAQADASLAPEGSAANPVVEPRTIAGRFQLVQGGSTGGTIGKTGQSLSGDNPSKATSPEKGRTQPPSSISGRWEWTQDCQIGSYRGHLQISQTGASRFSGRIFQESPNLSGAIFEGRIQGNQVSFRTTLNLVGTTGFETWSGSLPGPGRMQGTATTPRVGTCTWSASRK
jgi:hypothetical protein